MAHLLSLVLLAAFPVVAYSSLSITTATADELASIIAGNGITITAARFIGCNANQAGLFSDGSFDLGMDSGAVISSNYVVDAEGPNDNIYSHVDTLGLSGYGPLDTLLHPHGRVTKDACVLHNENKCDDPARFG